MARKRRHEEHENHERWLVSYADFITLLFAFFVVMYSVSSVNEGKMRVLSDTLVATFTDRYKSLAPIQVGKLVRSPSTDDISARTSPVMIKIHPYTGPGDKNGSGNGNLPLLGIKSGRGGQDDTGKAVSAGPKLASKPRAGVGPALAPAAKAAPPHAARHKAGVPAGAARPAAAGQGAAGKNSGGQAAGSAPASLEKVGDKVLGGLAGLLKKRLVSVHKGGHWLAIELNTSILFASGDAKLSPDSVPVLAQIAAVLQQFPNPVQVEGFTDNVPISTVAYPSNWELSAARAASVVHLFMQQGVRPGRMVALGYGQYRPVASNDTAAGRSRNRRVVIVIAAEPAAHRKASLDHIAAAANGQARDAGDVPAPLVDTPAAPGGQPRVGATATTGSGTAPGAGRHPGAHRVRAAVTPPEGTRR